MEPISEHVFEGHLQSLQRIFDAAFVSPGNTKFVLSPYLVGGEYQIVLQTNESTITATNDLGATAVCATLYSGNQKILCSFFEKWTMVGTKRKTLFRFDLASLTFFLALRRGDKDDYKQIFRLEWDNWKEQEQPNKAAYPHWQFDRWLTASSPTETLEALQKKLETDHPGPQQDGIVFESAEQALPAPELRPNLNWFTKIHFPSIAPWATDPIKDLDDQDQPHRCIPESVDELEGWIKSALAYLKNEIDTYT